ncbi:hypothetical protein TNCV_1788161 [Trichonephila clavipes]|nr:hypothetical protein TNCV_1788161 [Trichonephila clavipes]
MQVIDLLWPYPSNVTDAPRLHSLVLPVVMSSASHFQRTKRSSPSMEGVEITRLPTNTMHCMELTSKDIYTDPLRGLDFLIVSNLIDLVSFCQSLED